MEAQKPLVADQDVVEQIASLALAAAKQKSEIRLLMCANGHEAADAVPGARPKLADDGVTVLIEDGKPVFPTYGEQMAESQAHIDRLESLHPKLWPRVEKLLDDRRAQLDGDVA